MSGTNVVKVLYKPMGLVVSILGGMLAGMLFKRLWKLTAGDQEVPAATDAGQSWGAVLLAAAAEGAVFGLVKAAMDRGVATGVRRLTGVWPAGPERPDDETAGGTSLCLPLGIS